MAVPEGLQLDMDHRSGLPRCVGVSGDGFAECTIRVFVGSGMGACLTAAHCRVVLQSQCVLHQDDLVDAIEVWWVC